MPFLPGLGKNRGGGGEGGPSQQRGQIHQFSKNQYPNNHFLQYSDTPKQTLRKVMYMLLLTLNCYFDNKFDQMKKLDIDI